MFTLALILLFITNGRRRPTGFTRGHTPKIPRQIYATELFRASCKDQFPEVDLTAAVFF